MNHRDPSMLMVGLLATNIVTGTVAADPPQPGTEGNGLPENESTTLWSRATDNYISQAEYRQRHGENRSAVHQVANETDVTFKRPPATAATWTQNDLEDLDVGEEFANTELDSKLRLHTTTRSLPDTGENVVDRDMQAFQDDIKNRVTENGEAVPERTSAETDGEVTGGDDDDA